MVRGIVWDGRRRDAVRSAARTGAGALGLALAASLGATGAYAQQVVDLPAEDRPLTAAFDEVFRIGSIEGELWETFGDVAGTAFDAAGNLYVFDRQANRIAVVDRAGNFVREVGTPGEGPGEFRMALSFTVMRDGTIVVADMGHRAYQLFGPDGAFRRMVSMQSGDGVIRLGDLAPHPDGASIISGGGGTMMMSASGGRGGRGGMPSLPQTRPIDRISLTGESVERTVIAEGWQPPPGEPRDLEGGGLRFSMAAAGPRTFEPGLRVGALPDGGVVFADTSTYTLKVAGPTGGVTRILRRPFAPRPVTERMREAEKERRLQELLEGGGPQMRIMTTDGSGPARPIPQEQIDAIMRNQIETMQFYPELSVIQDVASSWTGKVWVERRGDAPTDPGPIDVLTAEGRYMGTFETGATEIPDSFGPDGLAAYIELDDFDVPTIVVRRLPPVLN